MFTECELQIEEYILGDPTDNLKFVSSLRVQLCSVSDVKVWLRQFSTLSKTQWIHRSSVAATESTRFAVSYDFVCHHSAYRKVGWALRPTFR